MTEKARLIEAIPTIVQESLDGTSVLRREFQEIQVQTFVNCTT